TYDLWRTMHARAAEEHGQRLSDEELISSVFRRAYGGDDTPAYKIAIKQCPDRKRTWQYSGGRDIEIDPAVAECAACGAIHLASRHGGRVRSRPSQRAEERCPASPDPGDVAPTAASRPATRPTACPASPDPGDVAPTAASRPATRPTACPASPDPGGAAPTAA